jgi:glycosyltransferase involved in cell wall biosynthesis
MDPLVSIFMPTYNHAKFLNESINSVLNQTYQNIEIIIGDDYSEDNSHEIILNFKKKYPNKIKYYHNNKNIGIGKHFKELYKKCNGDFIAHFSGDDIFYPDKIFKQVEFMKEHPDCILCGHDVDIIDADGIKKKYKFSDLNPITRGEGLKKIIENGTCAPGQSWLVRRRKVNIIEFDESIKYRNDWKLLIDIIGKNGKFDYINGVYAAYRMHDHNLSKKNNLDKYVDLMKIFRHTMINSNGYVIIYWFNFILNSIQKSFNKNIILKLK